MSTEDRAISRIVAAISNGMRVVPSSAAMTRGRADGSVQPDPCRRQAQDLGMPTIIVPKAAPVSARRPDRGPQGTEVRTFFAEALTVTSRR
jgi:hypothetical protein